MLLRKYLLVTESQVSKCGFHIVKKKGYVLYPKRTKYSKYRKGISGRGCKPDGTQLGFGRYGTKSYKAGRLSYRAIEAARRPYFPHSVLAISAPSNRPEQHIRIPSTPLFITNGISFTILLKMERNDLLLFLS